MDDLIISEHIRIPSSELEWQAIRAQGAGGQHVNKVSTALQLRYDITASSLPEECKERLLALRDRRISGEGVIVIKAQRFRSQEKNREDALERLRQLVEAAATRPKRRVSTRPSRASKQRRLDGKTRRGQVKSLRRKIT